MGGGAAHNLKFFKANEDRSMACGVFVLNKSGLTTIDYTCSEYTIVLEGKYAMHEVYYIGMSLLIVCGWASVRGISAGG